MEHIPPSGSTSRRTAVEHARQQRRKARRRRTMGTLGFVVVLLLIGIGVGYYLTQRGTTGMVVHVEGEIIPVENRMLVLVLGMDALEPNHTDTIMLASFDSTTGHAGLLSIPRDTRVAIPGRAGMHRVNVAHAYGGPQTTVNVVQSLLGVQIDYWVRLDFDGFRHVVDALGGVEMNIPRAMQYTDTAQNLYIDLQPGLQRLDGDKALQYVRYRADGLGDVSLADPVQGTYKGRVDRQLQFVQALIKQALKPANVAKAPLLVPQLAKAVDTNLPLDKMLRLVGVADRLDLTSMESLVLPGNSQTIGGASYWIAEESMIKQAVNRIVLGRQRMVKVAVLNGNGRAGVATQVAGSLRGEGMFVDTIGNADRYDYPVTQVVPVHGDGQMAHTVARVVGGQVTDNVPVPAHIAQSGADVLVIVGQDYKGH